MPITPSPFPLLICIFQLGILQFFRWNSLIRQVLRFSWELHSLSTEPLFNPQDISQLFIRRPNASPLHSCHLLFRDWRIGPRTTVRDHERSQKGILNIFGAIKVGGGRGFRSSRVWIFLWGCRHEFGWGIAMSRIWAKWTQRIEGDRRASQRFPTHGPGVSEREQEIQKGIGVLHKGFRLIVFLFGKRTRWFLLSKFVVPEFRRFNGFSTLIICFLILPSSVGLSSRRSGIIRCQRSSESDWFRGNCSGSICSWKKKSMWLQSISVVHWIDYMRFSNHFLFSFKSSMRIVGFVLIILISRIQTRIQLNCMKLKVNWRQQYRIITLFISSQP
jgi:hypothetical protein